MSSSIDVARARQRSRLGISGAVLTLCVAAGALVLAPSVEEQRAMERRTVLERIDVALRHGDVLEAISLAQPLALEPNADPVTVRSYLQLLIQAGQVPEHARLVTGTLTDRLTADDLRSARALYNGQGLEKHGARLLEALAERPDASFDEMAAVMQIRRAAGHARAAAQLAVRIAQRLERGQSAAVGVAIIEIMMEAGDQRQALRFLQEWTRDSSPDALLTVASLLVTHGRASLAASLLERRQHESATLRSGWLYAVSKSGDGIRRDDVAFTQDILRKLPQLEGRALSEELYNLFRFGRIDMALDHFARTGAWAREPVRGTLIASLRERGQEALLRNYLRTNVRRSGLGTSGQREVAGIMASLGWTGDAEELLRSIVEAEDHDSRALGDLLFVWRSAGRAPDESWLLAQVTPRNARGWVKTIAEKISPALAVKAIERLEPALDRRGRANLVPLKARYAAWSGNGPALRQSIAEAATGRISSPEVARLACASDDTAAAMQLVEALTSAVSDDLLDCAARIELARAREALAREQLTDAFSLLESALARPSIVSAQDYFDFAEAAHANGRTAQASALYEAALAGLAEPAEPSHPTWRLRVAALLRLGRTAEAQTVLADILEFDPSNLRARALLSQLKLDARDYAGALATASTSR